MKRIGKLNDQSNPLWKYLDYVFIFLSLSKVSIKIFQKKRRRCWALLKGNRIHFLVSEPSSFFQQKFSINELKRIVNGRKKLGCKLSFFFSSRSGSYVREGKDFIPNFENRQILLSNLYKYFEHLVLLHQEEVYEELC